MPFTPASIGSCKSWWDASDTASATVVGTDLHQLNDQIGNFAPMQGAVEVFTTYMDYGLRTINGLNTASTVHSSVVPIKSLSCPNWRTGFPGAEGTIYVVCSVDQVWDAETPNIFNIYDQFPGQTQYMTLLGEDHYHLYFYPSVATSGVTGSPLSRHGIEAFSSFMDSLPHIYKISWSVANNIATFSGDGGDLFPTLTASGFTSIGSITRGGIEIGNNIIGGNQGTFQFCEMTLHNAYIADGSSDDLAMVEYFRNKWALQVGTNKLTTTTTSTGGLSGGVYLNAVSIATDGTLFVAPKDNPNCFRWNTGVNSRFDNVFAQTRVPTASQAWGQGAPKCYDLAVAPSNSNRVYAVVNHLGSTTVWKSTDSGTTWTDTAHTVPFSAGPGAGPCVAIDPSDPDKVMIGCSNGHIHESSNAGSSWTDRDLSGSGGGTSYACIVFESTTSIYIGWLAGATNVLHSSNSGSTWSSAAASGPTTVRGICCSTTGVVYACSNAGTTTNAWKLSGGTWTNLSLAITGETWVFPAVDPNSATHMALVSTSGYLQYSTNSGTSGYTEPVPPTTGFPSSLDVAWLISPFNPWGGTRPPNFGCDNSYAASRVLFDPAHSGRLYLTCETGLFYSTPATTGPVVSVYGLSGGSGYTPAVGQQQYFSISLTGGTGSSASANITVTNGAVSLVTFTTVGGTGYSQADSLSAAAAGIGGTVTTPFSIKANIVDWSQQNKNIGGLQINDIVRVPVVSNLMNNMLFSCQVKNAGCPNALRTEPTFIIGGEASDHGFCCDYAKGTTLNQFVLSAAALWRTIDLGADGFTLADGVSNLGAVSGIDSNPMMAVSNTSSLCILSGTGKKYTTDAITAPTWSNCAFVPAIGAASASNGRSHVLVNDGVTAATMYALIPNNGVYKSTDSGANWTQQTASSAALPTSYAQGSQLSGAPGQAGHLFFAGGNTGALPLAKSTDGGANWTAVSNTTEAWQVSVGKLKSGGTYPSIFITGKVSGDSDPGVFRSDDNCSSWTRVCRAPAGNLDAPNKLFADLDNYGTFMLSMGTTGFTFGELDVETEEPPPSGIDAATVVFQSGIIRAAPRRIPQVPQWAATSIGASDTDFFMFAGQSNMIGSGTTGSADLAPYPWIVTDSNIVYYDGSFHTNTIGPATQWGPEAQFSYLWRQRFPTKKFYFLKIAISSTFLANTGSGDNWSPAAAGAWFDYFKAYADIFIPAVVADRGTPGRITLCWMQGESDATDATHASNYQTNLTNFFSNVRSRWGASNTKIIVGRVANTEPFASTVRSGQAAAVVATTSTALVNTDSYPLADGLHYNPAGQISLGADMFNAYLSLT